jgi:GNAT superfamily N-acetyltransferase
MAKIGMLSFILKFGIKSLIRMLGLNDLNKLSLSKSIKVSDYYYLSMVVVRNEYRGKGIGSYAIKHAIQEIISSNTTCKFIGLTTQLAENVTFYARLGFEKIDEGYINFKGDRYYNYNLKQKLEISN